MISASNNTIPTENISALSINANVFNNNNVKQNLEPIFEIDFSKKSSSLVTKFKNFHTQVNAKQNSIFSFFKNKLYKGRKEALNETNRILTGFFDSTSPKNAKEVLNDLEKLLTKDYYAANGKSGKARSKALLDLINEMKKQIGTLSEDYRSPYAGIALLLGVVSNKTDSDCETGYLNALSIFKKTNSDAFDDMLKMIVKNDKQRNTHLSVENKDGEKDTNVDNKQIEKILVNETIFNAMEKVLTEHMSKQ